jgi:hypothetical protein
MAAARADRESVRHRSLRVERGGRWLTAARIGVAEKAEEMHHYVEIEDRE